MSINKSFSTETSERYSRALFEVSKESSEIDKVEDDIKNFLLLYNNSSEVRNFIKDPTQSIFQQNDDPDQWLQRSELPYQLGL